MVSNIGKEEIYSKSFDALSSWSSDYVTDKECFDFRETYGYHTWQSGGY